DFKVTGTADGITATQMDIKVDGLSYEVLATALEQARKGRMHILGKITETIAEPREDYRPFVPRIVQIQIPKDFIGAVIGPGGKVIQEIQKTTGTTITITENDECGVVDIFGIDKEALDGALARIKGIVAVPEVGEVYDGTIKSIVAFGAFVEILPGKEALLHISEIDYKRFETMEETGLKEGDKIEVKLIGVDPKTNKYKLSHKAVMPKPEGWVERERKPRAEGRPEGGRPRGDRPERRGGDRNKK
ncbi:MAG: S1 RNA-binding domain-containing protein, partial [Alistipes sp.]|nr:S1 RNA-binding domain-containing protein [Alistipes sp.]